MRIGRDSSGTNRCTPYMPREAERFETANDPPSLPDSPPDEPTDADRAYRGAFVTSTPLSAELVEEAGGITTCHGTPRLDLPRPPVRRPSRRGAHQVYPVLR